MSRVTAPQTASKPCGKSHRPRREKTPCCSTTCAERFHREYAYKANWPPTLRLPMHLSALGRALAPRLNRRTSLWKSAEKVLLQRRSRARLHRPRATIRFPGSRSGVRARRTGTSRSSSAAAGQTRSSPARRDRLRAKHNFADRAPPPPKRNSVMHLWGRSSKPACPRRPLERRPPRRCLRGSVNPAPMRRPPSASS